MEYLFLCPYAGLAFHFFLDKKTKQPARTYHSVRAGKIKPACQPLGLW
jgi:hypothetical protein